mmetsp:Transcript_38935/g.98163  ORF Transcript_38935/g.98163 Transcript_38935/m.98163 type:complete len:315 (-) Transcript_38935:157-1101(-)|eukprot:CAMPEP_0177658744 /NCGR_PEP_ID=MMETSP0447-20121125/17019_1 /TAXON_ID=0 /ORGANISM="Stygamoeba regulata, Strain BSH-02190019" /LENGTH=314 /DNA_ID=CAMNT_0019163461 /DNA_START=34 /DNA_END=978 /DNA_ORIENTATION=-
MSSKSTEKNSGGNNDVEKEISVGVLAKAFTFPASMSKADVFAACQDQLGLDSKKTLQLCQMTPFKRGRSTLSDKPLRRKFVCYVPNSEFTLDFIASTYEQNSKLTEQVEKSAEALIAFQQQLELNRREILSLRTALANAEEEKALAQNTLKEHILQSTTADSAEGNESTAGSPPAPTAATATATASSSTLVAEASSTTPTTTSAAAAAAAASDSDTENYRAQYEQEKDRADRLQAQLEGIQNRAAEAKAQAVSKAAEVLKSPRTEMGCRACKCTQFRSGSPSWICVSCGHTLVRHCVSSRDLRTNVASSSSSSK